MTQVERYVILVPAYNSQDTIEETLQSILAQGDALDEIAEVIIADDASTDDTRNIARKAWTSNTPLRILEPHQNRGEYVNVNEAVNGFSDDVSWFLIMHADNMAKPEWLRTLLTAIREAGPKTGSISTSWDDLSVGGDIRPGDNQPGKITIRGSVEATRDTLKQGCWWHISACAIRVSAYKAVGGLPRGLRLKGDWDFLLRLLSAGWDIDYIPRAYMLYRENAVGSSSVTFRRHRDVFESLLVVRRHAQALSRTDLLGIHFFHVKSLARRSVRSIISGDVARLAAIVPATGEVVQSLVKSLARKPEARS